MKKILYVCMAGLLSWQAAAQVPGYYKWMGEKEVVFSYDGTFTDEACFRLTLPKGTRTGGVRAPERYAAFPVQPAGAVNLTYSPDSTLLAFTRDNDLYVARIADGKEVRLTSDGSATILNGYASWVYYEEIFGRPSRYRAFWWSPDSRRLAFYRFDDTEVPMFPIYSPFEQDGTLRETHYPKAGEKNPEVRIGFVETTSLFLEEDAVPEVVWAGFDETQDQYFGTPFWSRDAATFYVAREPRIQNTLDLYAVDPADGTKVPVYHETSPTWLNWIEGMLFSEKGLYMVRDFETHWQQIYFLSYDGTQLRRLTDGENWRVRLLRADPDGTVYFTAQRDSLHVRQALYKVSPKGKITALTDETLNVTGVSFSPDGRYFVSRVSSLDTPDQLWVRPTRNPSRGWRVAELSVAESLPPGKIITLEHDGLTLPAILYLPTGFDPGKRYPVHVDIYGGPDTPLVTDRWTDPERYRWYRENGIIEVIADCRAAGHNGRRGLDRIYRQLSTVEVEDFIAWARYLQSLPYVQGDKIGVEGFSFGGTMATLLVAAAPDAYHYAIAGGGVYDWMLYDTHYTERFMSTPADNPEGYRVTRVLDRVGGYPARCPGGEGEPGTVSDGSVMLKLTHGTGDDNVHFQNTLQLIDVLHRMGADFEFMAYPDGMHGYRGYQGRHFTEANRAFWLRYLKGE